MKLNLGSGRKRLPGFINVDKWSVVEPDVVHDLETTPWPWEDDSVDEILMSHILEHLGQDPKVFFKIMQELYRVMKPGALLKIIVPHPRCDDFISSPDHVRPILPQTMGLFSKKKMQEAIDTEDATTPFAFEYDVDFDIEDVTFVIVDWAADLHKDGKLTTEEVGRLIELNSNVAVVIKMDLRKVGK